MAGGVTIRDVATAAQVSVATVSRALNGQANVTAEVRQRVLEAAKRLQYSPHAAARSLSSRRTHAIGVVLPDLYGEFFSELMRGIDQVAREHGMHLLVSSYHGHRDEQGMAMRAMRGRVDGLLVMSPYAALPASSDDCRSTSASRRPPRTSTPCPAWNATPPSCRRTCRSARWCGCRRRST
jgi:LacI family transcriptional regulator